MKLQHPPQDYSADPERKPAHSEAARRLLAEALAADRLALECSRKLADALQCLGREDVAETCTNLGGLLAERNERIASFAGMEGRELPSTDTVDFSAPTVEAPWPLRASTYRVLRAARSREKARLQNFLRRAGRAADDEERMAAEWLAAESLKAIAYLRLLAIRALGTPEGRNDDLARSLATRLDNVDELRRILDERRADWHGLAQRCLDLAKDNTPQKIEASIEDMRARLPPASRQPPKPYLAGTRSDGDTLKSTLVELCRSVAWTEELCELALSRTRNEEIMLLAQEGEVNCGALMEALTRVADAMDLPTSLSC